MVDVISSTTGTTASIALDSYVYGTIETGGDTDMYKVFLPGGNYHINLVGDAMFGNALSDPLLRIYNSAGGQVAIDDDNGAGSNSYIDFTIATAGTYYLAASGYTSGSYTGDYALSLFRDAAAVETIEPGMTVTGRGDTHYEQDDYAIFLRQGVTYTFKLEPQPGVDGPVSDPIKAAEEVELYFAYNADNIIWHDHSDTSVSYTYTVPNGQSGYFHLYAGAAFIPEFGHYTLTVTSNAPLANTRPSGADATRTIAEDGSYVFSASDFGFSDGNGDTLAGVYITALPATGTLTASGIPVALNQYITAISTLRWTPPANANGTAMASISFQVVDNGSHAGMDQFSNTITFNVNAVNDAPVITSNGSGDNATLAAEENNTAVTNVTATDVDSSSLTRTISGIDESLFQINADGVVTFKSAPDHETPRDSGHDNIYDIAVTVSDGVLADVQNLHIVVSNVTGNTVEGTSKDNIIDAKHAIKGKGATTEEDHIDGGKGDDALGGAAGDDSLIGGAGKDTLDGGAGADRLDGGKASDRFVFSAKLSVAGVDTIVKFEHDADKIALDDKVFKAIGPSLSDDEFYAKAGATEAKHKGEHIVYNKTTGDLYYDKDGKGGAAAVHFATLLNHPSNLDHGDFVIV